MCGVHGRVWWGAADAGSANGRNTVNVPPFRSNSQNTTKATSAAMTCVRVERLFEFLTTSGRRRELSSGVASSAPPACAASSSLLRRFGDTGTTVCAKFGCAMTILWRPRGDFVLEVSGRRCELWARWGGREGGGGGAGQSSTSRASEIQPKVCSQTAALAFVLGPPPHHGACSTVAWY
jgi:hypothetical protein